jgi:hypothetical protein
MIFGYLDPGTGSLILQAVLGGVAGIIVAAKAWNARLMCRMATAAEPKQDSVDESAVASDS